MVVKGQKNLKGAPLRTDFGLGGADVVTLNQARERALEYRRMATVQRQMELIRKMRGWRIGVCARPNP